MNELKTKGVTVVPFPEQEQFELHTFLTEQKEFVNSTVDTTFVMGAFGALGNPSSFHHPQVRQLRLNIFNHIKPYLQEQFPEHYIECLPDRFCIRNPDTSLSSESWHRDISNVHNKTQTRTGHDDDVIYGGWINLDKNNTQYFSCVPYTHTDTTNEGGFAKIKKEEAAQAQYKAKREKIAIPPGHMLIFNEKTVHEVSPTKQKTKSYRLFMKYRLTRERQPLFPNNRQVAIDQGVFPLSLAQNPPIYGKLHAVNWKPRLETFSQNIRPEFMDKKSPYVRVQRFMSSLVDVQYELFPPYTEEELAILTPH